MLEYWCHKRLGWRSPRHFSCCIPRPKSATYIIILKKGLIHLVKPWKEQAVLPRRGVSIFPGFTNTCLSQISIFFDVDPPSGCRAHCLPPLELLAGLVGADDGCPEPPEGDAQFLDGVSAPLEEDPHTRVHVGPGVVLALHLSEGRHQLPLWRQMPSGVVPCVNLRAQFLLLGATD